MFLNKLQLFIFTSAICGIVVVVAKWMNFTYFIEQNRQEQRKPIDNRGLPHIITDVNWTAIFQFLPVKLDDCEELFPFTSLSQTFMDKLKLYNEVIPSKDRGQVGYSAKHIKEYQAWLTLAQAPFVNTVCETGFNYGHSSFGFLTINPNVTVYSFDIGKWSYAKPMAEYLKNLYTGRLIVTWGDSTKTVPRFHEQHPDVTCDLVVVDGGHTGHVPRADLLNFRNMSHANTLVIVDDWPRGKYKDIGSAWETAKQIGLLSEIFRCHHDEKRKYSFSVGRYLY